MQFSSRTWSLISLSLLIAAGVFTKLGNDRRSRSIEQFNNTNSVTGATSKRLSSSVGKAGAQPFPLLSAVPAQPTHPSQLRVPGTGKRGVLPTDSKFPHRLRNSSKSYAELARSESAILLRNALIDTAEDLDLFVPEALRASEDPGSYLVQARGNIDEFFRAQLREVNAEIVAYIPHNALLVQMSDEQARAASGRSRIQAVLPFHPYYKLEYSLIEAAMNDGLTEDSLVLKVGLFPRGVENTLLSLREQGFALGEVENSPFGPIVLAELPKRLLPDLVAMKGVQAVETAKARVFASDRTRVLLGVSSDSTGPTNQYLGLTGTNVWVNVNDSGVDRTHKDLVGRVFGESPNIFSDPEGHGTFMAGVIAGNGADSTNVVSVPTGSELGAHFRGVAPGARIFAMGVDLTLGPLVSDSYLQRTAAETNYVLLKKTTPMISNNSWGYRDSKDYDLSAASFDAAVRDALPEVAGNQGMIYVFAAGNLGFGNQDGTGGEPDSLSSPATAKNVISVGAVEMRRRITNEVVVPDRFDPSRTQTNKAFQGSTDSDSQIADFSSRGNVGIGQEGLYGRFKPDVVAPGSFVVSARSRQWVDPVNALDPNLVRYPGQVAPPGGQNDYAVFIPDNAFSFEIQTIPNDASPVPFPSLPIYVTSAGTPTAANQLGSGNLAFPGQAPLGRGDLRFSVANLGNSPVAYDLITILTTTNATGDYYVQLKSLNDQLKPSYRFESGTSVSAASISGMLALMQQFFETNKVSYTPALMKALLLNGASSIGPTYDFHVANTINYQGWGMPKMDRVIPTLLATNLSQSDPTYFFESGSSNALATGESITWELDMPFDAADHFPLKVTLVWTDPPGNPNSGIKLVNDLDLIVSNSTTRTFFYGNFIPEDTDYNAPTPGGETNGFVYSDLVNNVETVLVSPTLSAFTQAFEVTVRAKRVNVNAVSGHRNGIVQDFALVASVGGKPVRFIRKPSAPVFQSTIISPTNGLPLLNQRVGANSPLQGGNGFPNNGVTNQWSFYVFTNVFNTNQPYATSLTNGENVAFITFVPPNLAKPRNFDADIDLYVSRNPALTNLSVAALAAADQSRNRGGTESVVYTNAPVGPDAVFYVAVKSEDQQGAEFGLVALSSNEPFERFDSNGNQILTAMPRLATLEDGSPSMPLGSYVFAVGVTPSLVNRVTANLHLTHDNVGDLLGNLSHDRAFAVLNNHNLNSGFVGPFHSFYFDDSDSGQFIGAIPSDGPGSLNEFQGTISSGPWIMTMVDNQLEHAGRLNLFEVVIEPSRVLGSNGINGSVLANRFSSFFVDVGSDASALEVILSRLTGPLNVYVRRDAQPTTTEYDKFAAFNPPGGTLSVTSRDVPPLTAGRYYIGVFNPGATTVDFTVSTRIERGLGQGFALSPLDSNQKPVNDDVRQYATNFVADTRPVTDVKVGVRIDHARLSDLSLRLISPQGKSVLLMENRGGSTTQEIGSQSVTTNFHHVALTYSRSNGLATLYIDGESIGAQAVGSVVADTRGDLFVGIQPVTNEFAAPFEGLIDELGLYNRSLAGSEIRAIHRFGNSAKATNGLVANWGMDGQGLDRFGTSNLEILGGRFVTGHEASALLLSQSSFGRTTNSSALNVGNGAGFTLEGWINPLNFATNRTIAVWSDGTNRIGSRLSVVAGIGGVPGLGTLSATLVGLDGTNRVINSDLPARLIANGVKTNHVFARFSEDTNVTRGPIKFAVPPFVTNSAANSVYLGGFEVPVNSSVSLVATPQSVDGWSVTSNQIALVNLPALAHTGMNVAALNTGAIRRSLPTGNGRRFQLTFVHRHQPEFEGIAAWWPGENQGADLVGFSPLIMSSGLGFTNGVVGRAFNFSKPGDTATGSDSPMLNLTNEISVELWFNRSAATTRGVLISKTSNTNDTTIPKSQFGIDLHPTLGLGFWFDDPSVNASPQSDDVGNSNLESVRVTPLPNAGSFHHVVGTLKQVPGGLVEARLYLNGRLAKEKQLPGILANTLNRDPVVIGSLITNLPNYSVAIDEPTVFGRALSNEEVALIYELRSVGKCQFPCSPETQITIGNDPPLTFTSGGDWATNSYTFTATSSATTLDLRPESAGVLFDSFEMKEIFGADFLPEESLKDILGDSGLGNWRLELTDSRVGPVPDAPLSKLVAWELNLTFAPTNYSAIRLTNGVTYSNIVAAGQSVFFIVEPPRSSTRSTNSLSSALPLDLAFNQTGLPTGGGNAGDLTLLSAVNQGISVIATNGTTSLNTNGIPITTTGIPRFLPGQRYYLGLRNPGLTTPYSIRVDFDQLDPDIAGLTILRDGQSILTNIAVTNALDYYRYTVSTNAVATTFSVFPTNGNVNLYVRKATRQAAALPTSNRYDYASENPGNQPEAILVGPDSPVPLTPGDWYLGVRNVDTNRVVYSILVTESRSSNSGTNVIRINDKQALDATSPAGGGLTLFYHFVAAGDPVKLLFETYNLTGNVDLLVKRGALPSLVDFDFSSQAVGLSPEQIVLSVADVSGSLNGDWFLGVVDRGAGFASYTVRGAQAFAGSILTGGRSPLLSINPVLTPGGDLQITVASVKGEKYRVESSADLVQWTALRTVTATGSSLTFEESPVVGASMLFYRVIQLP